MTRRSIVFGSGVSVEALQGILDAGEDGYDPVHFDNAEDFLDGRRYGGQHYLSFGLLERAVRVQERLDPGRVDVPDFAHIHDEVVVISGDGFQMGQQVRRVGEVYFAPDRKADGTAEGLSFDDEPIEWAMHLEALPVPAKEPVLTVVRRLPSGHQESCQTGVRNYADLAAKLNKSEMDETGVLA